MSCFTRVVLSLAIAVSFGSTVAVSHAEADQPHLPARQAAAAKPLRWIGDYGLALSICRANAKPLLVVIEKPDAPPFRILPTTLITSESNDRMLANYTLCRVDVTTEYGRRVAECFQAKQFPYTAIIDNRGSQVLFRKAGKFDTKSWVSALVEYQSGERKQLAPDFCFT